jgi:phospholipid transport system transporter-binding protein
MQAGARQEVRAAVSEPSSGRVVVDGELTFATAREARQVGLLVLESSRADRIVIDCAGVTRADSAGLAVLLDWLAWGRRKSRGIKLENLPASLLAIARISEVDELLSAPG